MRNLIFLVILFFILACGNEGSSEMSEFEAAPELAAMDRVQSKSVVSNGSDEQVVIEQKLIKTGGIDFESEDVEADYMRIKNALPTYEAYIQNENQSRTDQRISYNLTIRVPSTRYDSLQYSIATLGLRLENRYSNIQDVTDQYYDLQTRIDNKKALEARYLELLNQARDMKDILEIERNLNDVRTEIERMQGQLNYLSKQINYSTLHVNFYQKLPYVYDTTSRKGFFSRLMKAVDNGWQGFLTFFVGVVMMWPFFLLIGIAIYLLRRFRRKKKSS